MIAKLTGIFDSTGADWAIIDVGGVGYLVHCSGRTLSRLPPAGEPGSLLIDMRVREDHTYLYGFMDAGEREWFRLLTAVQAVGGKVALAILTVLPPEDLARAVAAGDRAALARADGVGPKLAGRIITELRDKVGEIAIAPAPGAPPPEGESAADAVSALVNLGYRRTEAYGAVAHAAQRLGPKAPIEDLIRAGLKELGS